MQFGPCPCLMGDNRRQRSLSTCLSYYHLTTPIPILHCSIIGQLSFHHLPSDIDNWYSQRWLVTMLLGTPLTPLHVKNGRSDGVFKRGVWFRSLNKNFHATVFVVSYFISKRLFITRYGPCIWSYGVASLFPHFRFIISRPLIARVFMRYLWYLKLSNIQPSLRLVSYDFCFA